jgi:hypothetical protein
MRDTLRALIWLVRAMLIPLAAVAVLLNPGATWGVPLMSTLGGMVFCWGLMEVAAFAARYWWLEPKRRRKGLCAHCGYNLNDLPLKNAWHCPECGRLRC